MRPEAAGPATASAQLGAARRVVWASVADVVGHIVGAGCALVRQRGESRESDVESVGLAGPATTRAYLGVFTLPALPSRLHASDR
jgi:hypothetical protein